MIATEDSNDTKTRHNNFTTNWNNWYLLNYLTLLQIHNDYKLVSFDVKSLFTSIPLQLALQCTETAILQSTDPLLLPTEDIMDLLNLCLTSTYFQYNGKHYNQLYSTAIGSPVSVVVAEIVMQHRGKRPFDLPIIDTALVTLRWRYFHRRTTRRNRRIPPPPQGKKHWHTERSKKMVNYLF